MSYQIINGNCLDRLENPQTIKQKIDLTFFDPPFNQGKDYKLHNDSMEKEDYWEMIKNVCSKVFYATSDGGAIYFMQREKNAEFVLNILRKIGWTFQNLIIWKKKSSAIPVANKFGKQYQIIVYATKGSKARVFHRLRIDPEIPPHYKYKRQNGLFVTDIWDDIRELTSGFFAGNEVIRHKDGTRFHKQQSPIALLLRIILSSTFVGDSIFDPFAGTGTTSLVAHQLQRNSLSIEIDPINVEYIEKRIRDIKQADKIEKYYKDYIHTKNLSKIWGSELEEAKIYNKQEEILYF